MSEFSKFSCDTNSETKLLSEAFFFSESIQMLRIHELTSLEIELD